MFNYCSWVNIIRTYTWVLCCGCSLFSILLCLILPPFCVWSGLIHCIFSPMKVERQFFVVMLTWLHWVPEAGLVGWPFAGPDLWSLTFCIFVNENQIKLLFFQSKLFVALWSSCSVPDRHILITCHWYKFIYKHNSKACSVFYLSQDVFKPPHILLTCWLDFEYEAWGSLASRRQSQQPYGEGRGKHP